MRDEVDFLSRIEFFVVLDITQTLLHISYANIRKKRHSWHLPTVPFRVKQGSRLHGKKETFKAESFPTLVEDKRDAISGIHHVAKLLALHESEVRLYMVQIIRQRIVLPVIIRVQLDQFF